MGAGAGGGLELIEAEFEVGPMELMEAAGLLLMLADFVPIELMLAAGLLLIPIETGGRAPKAGGRASKDGLLGGAASKAGFEGGAALNEGLVGGAASKGGLVGGAASNGGLVGGAALNAGRAAGTNSPVMGSIGMSGNCGIGK